MRVRQLHRAEAETILGKQEPEQAGHLRARPALIRFVADEKAEWLEELCCKPQALPFRCRGTPPEALIPRPLASEARLPATSKKRVSNRSLLSGASGRSCGSRQEGNAG